MCYDLLDTKEFDNRLIELRRDFHKYPEPGWLEYHYCENNRNTYKPWCACIMGERYSCFKCYDGLTVKEKQVAAMDRAIKETGRADMISQMSKDSQGLSVLLRAPFPALR